MTKAGFDVNSFLREYAQRVILEQLPLPKDDLVRVVPVGGDEKLILTVEDIRRIAIANDPELGIGKLN